VQPNSPELIPDESELVEAREIELPRWVQVPIGVILSLFTLLCGFASAYLIFVPNKKAPGLAFVISVFLLVGCAWVLEKCFRLITGRKKRGGLMTPRTLRIASFFLLVLPVIGLFTGYYRDVRCSRDRPSCMYFFGFFGLRALARKRENQEPSRDRRFRSSGISSLDGYTAKRSRATLIERRRKLQHTPRSWLS
jgi:hypothetical protein